MSGVVISEEYDLVDAGHYGKAAGSMGMMQSMSHHKDQFHGDVDAGMIVAAEAGLGGCIGRCFNICAGSHGHGHDENYKPPPQVVAIYDRLKEIKDIVGEETKDVLDQDWSGPNGKNPLEILADSKDKKVQADMIKMICEYVKPVIQRDPTVTEITAPCKVVGDIHGQFRDILLMFADFGFPSPDSEMSWCFNGDWVDRGKHQLEVVIMVFVLKIMMPTKVALNRGNHEDPEQNRFGGDFGFQNRCLQRLGNQDDGIAVFKTVHEVFAYLPVGCRIDKQILCVHGGLGDGNWSVRQVVGTRRPLNHKQLCEDPVIWNILWSDPTEDQEQRCFGSHSSCRDGHAGVMKTFGKDVTKNFCNNNNLAMVVRSHQAKPNGKGYDVLHDGRLIRVFTARDYEGCRNSGAILDVQRTDGSDKLVVKPQVLKALTAAWNDNDLKGAYNGDGGNCVMQ